MAEFTLEAMLTMQRELQQKYLEKWGGVSPERGVEKLLWLHGELGEAGDDIKKNGVQKIMEDASVRRHFVEELCDALMYWNDVLLCFDISAEEVQEIYLEKHKRNMNRW